MPSRILREGIIGSQRINALSPTGEVFYRRLMSVADDYGSFHASVPTLRGALWPTNPESVSEESVRASLAECTRGENPLIKLYSSGGAKYLQITNFNQQIRSKSKFPTPCWEVDNGPLANCDQSAQPSRSRISYPESYSESSQNLSSAAEAVDGKTDSPVAAKAIELEIVAEPADVEVKELSVNVWFEASWAIYWRKVAKEAARKAFKARVKTAESYALVNAALIRQQPEMLAREPQHRPHFSTWLNQERMLDEPSPPQQGGAQRDRNQRRREETKAGLDALDQLRRRGQ
jgi:hypothetical protein